MNAIDLISTQMALECIGITVAGELIRIPGPNPDTIARLFVVQHDGNYAAYPRHDLAAHIRRKLHTLPPKTAFYQQGAVQAILEEDSRCDDIFVGKSCVFATTMTPDDYADVIRLDESHQRLIDEYDHRLVLSRGTVYAVIQHSHIVSTCESSRENETAGEAWVRTLPEYRRLGYARQTTAAWAHNLQQEGKIPFYSHRWDNLASQAVAQSLGAIQYQAFVAYT